MIIPRSNAARGDFTRLKNCVPKFFVSYVFLRNSIFCPNNQFLLNQCCTQSFILYPLALCWKSGLSSKFRPILGTPLTLTNLEETKKKRIQKKFKMADSKN